MHNCVSMCDSSTLVIMFGHGMARGFVCINNVFIAHFMACLLIME